MKWKELLSTHRFKVSGKSSRVERDMRDQFDRDFDRIVYSAPFRRLQDKTQVFPLEPNDSVRTRLTHSLEVSHASKGLAKDVCCELLDRGRVNSQQAKWIETIAEACGLIHDLGNPPFGHSGEVAIQEWFTKRCPDVLKGLNARQRGDFVHFEGNAQTLRILTRLQILADYHGLNLTCGTLSASCKYIASSTGVRKEPHERSKLGFFSSEDDLVSELRQITGTGDARNPITFIVEAADDAAYNAVDLEDGFKKGILDWKMLRDELEREAGADDPVLRECLEWAEKRVDEAEVKLEGRGRDSALIEYLRVWMIGKFVTGAARVFLDHYEEIMAGQYHGELVPDSDAGPLLKACKAVNRSRVYCSDETLKLELMGRQIIWDLMDLFWEGAEDGTGDAKRKGFSRKAYDLLSDNYRSAHEHAIKTSGLPERYCNLQLVTDYVCGMTDSFATDLHRRLRNG